MTELKPPPTKPAPLVMSPLERAAGRFRDYLQLAKLRLSAVVVFSAFIAFLAGSGEVIDWTKGLVVVLGGFVVTAASNTFNQILEIGRDAQMVRTANRPLPAGRMGNVEALAFALLLGTVGVLALWRLCGPLSGWLALTSLLVYAFVYTPMKQVGSVAVYVGAIPGALPVLIGYAAAKGTLDATAGAMFAIQFVWQFPHFWAIAWLAHGEYAKAGYQLLPVDGPTRASATVIVVSAIVLAGAGLLPLLLGVGGWASSLLGVAFGVLLTWLSIRLRQRLDRQAALQLMLAALLYLPVVLTAVYLDLNK